jgi:hypothetical protein
MGARGILALALLALADSAEAQARRGSLAGDFAALGVLAFLRADPTAERRAASEVRLTQPTLLGRLSWRPLAARLTLNLEGITMEAGELAPGSWGEGFIDRRHPHTYLHELLLEGATRREGLRLGAFLGKGFVPFGSDDPMSRPLARYPVNHHLAQVLERAVMGAQAGLGPAALELALFNGDEPERPAQWPNLGRFGDSWSVRAHLFPKAGLELTASAARVASPEHRPGAGAAQRKVHAGVRYSAGGPRGRVYLLGEWARTSELEGTFVFRSGLVEAAVARGRHEVAYRWEQADRPEEERISAFRSVRPHLENSILGTTRWTLHSASHRWRLIGTRPGPSLASVVEVSVGSVRSIGGGAFQVVETYGQSEFWSVTVGLRVAWKVESHRMGRYGILAAENGGQHP